MTNEADMLCSDCPSIPADYYRRCESCPRRNPAARPAPDGGLVEREAVAKELVAHGEFSSLGASRNYESALIAADAILALLSSRAVAGEPVAYLCESKVFNRREVHFEKARNREYVSTPLYAHPAPSGRDPATIATVQYIRRDDGGLRVCSDDIPGLVLSGSDADAVAADVWPAICAIVTEERGTPNVV